ncbi:MAG: NAD(P)H-hydrate dehydratase, partial [Gammaproteobacteria bacterium]|nr:NAD(P)H-hydrate dehydratase [Gammaproteobacteria bacterium]
MKADPLALYSATQTRRLDQIAIEDYGIPGYTLMCRAGTFAFNTLISFFHQTRSIVIVCGIGNNAGDGYVMARLAKENGFPVRVLQLGNLAGQRGDALKARTDMETAGVHVEAFTTAAIEDSSVIVDAIFGTGLEREIEGEWKDAIDAINNSGRPVLAVDIPSGLQADTGQKLGCAIKAQVTCSFIGPKQGMYTGCGPELCGEIRFDGLQVPDQVYDRVQSQVRRWNEVSLDLIAPRPLNSHKGQNGHVLLVGGDHGMSGAIRMAGEACLRSGAGLVSLATRESHAALIAQSCPELMSHGSETLDAYISLRERATVLAIGPGLGTSEWGQALFGETLKSSLPKVIDADALNCLAINPQRRDDWILTPHPGEAARLLQCSVQDIENNRFQSGEEVHRRFGGI